jgi:mono/diheme cytochrome c family protein
MWKICGAAALAAALVVGATSSGRSQEAWAAIPPGSGEALYLTYCASCHGTSGRGDGPVADLLRVRPANLTRFATQNGGVFPTAKLQRVIDGRDVGSHGNPDMPVWGDAFRISRGGLSEAGVTARIDAIVRFLESIQERTAE